MPPPPLPQVPEAGAHVWEWFWRLSSRRQHHEGPQPITYTEIRAWVDMTGTLITPEEVDMLIWMDNAYRGKASEEIRAMRDSKTEAPAPKPKSRML